MLEEIVQVQLGEQDQLELDPEQQKQFDRDLAVKKEGVTRAKKANMEQRERLREQAQAIEKAQTELIDQHLPKLRAQQLETEEAQVAEKARQAKQEEQAAAVAQARQALQEKDEKIRMANAESAELAQRLRELQNSAAQVDKSVKDSESQCSSLETKLVEANRVADAQAAEQRERNAWYQQASRSMTPSVPAGAATVANDFVAPTA